MIFLTGADPELFVRRAGELVSGFGLIPGDKKNPHKVDNGAVQVDGMALEFNIDPADSEDNFLNNINSVLAQLAAMVPEHELEVVPVAHFGREVIDLQPIEAKELGCEPDFNAWTADVNKPPNPEIPFRTGSGHVHIGWGEGFNPEDPGHFTACCTAVKQLDYALGLSSLLLEPANERRELYGAAGAFRPKSYGVEYRVLSNFWLKSPTLIRWVYRTTQRAMNDLVDGKRYNGHQDDVVSIINNNNVKAARRILKHIGIEVPK